MITANNNRRQVEDYISSVLDGTTVAGKLVIAAVERHVRDLSRVNDDDVLYEFDYHAANRACLFFPAGLKHSIGEWAGHPFELADWQKFIIWSVYGWKRKADGYRRFRKVYITVARKNGKSTLASGFGLLSLLADGEPGAQVFIGATKIDQACIVHSEAEKMVRSSPSLMKLCELHKNNISVPESNSFMRPTGSDKPYDGPGPHCMIFDELHAWKERHRPFYETMTSGSGARRQPLQVIITTAGDNHSFLWKDEDKYISDVVSGVVQDDKVFGFIARIDPEDDPFDEVCWPKANPNLGICLKEEYLKEKAQDAVHKPMALNVLMRYHCNIEVTSVEQFVTKEMWDAAEGELSDWSEADFVGAGFDLGGRDDLAGCALVARFPVPQDEGPEGGDEDDAEDSKPVWRYEIRTRSYIADSTKRELDKQPFAQWIHEGRLEVSGNVIAQLRDELIADAREYGIDQVAFDPNHARQLGNELADEGFDAADMPQSYRQFNEPIEEFLRCLVDGRIRHNGDSVLRWCVLNMTMKTNHLRQRMPDKKESIDKIDTAVAMLMAFREAMFAEPRHDWTAKDGVLL